MDNKLIYQIVLDLKNNVSASLKDVKNKFKEIDDAAAKVANTTNRVNSVCSRLSSLDLGNMMNMLDRSGQALQKLGTSGMTFEQSMADLSSITGIAGKDLEALGEVARETGKESGLGAAGAADAFALLASQIQVDKIGMEGLITLQKETITLAQAGGMGMAEAATAMAATINQFGLEATDANRVINVLAAGSKYGAAEISDLAQSFKVSGAVAAAAGLSVEQAAGAIEVLSKNNLKGAEAGTALRNIMLKMQTELGIDLGETGLSTALEALKPKLNDVTYLSKTFGMENVAAAQFLITNAAAVDEMTAAVTGTNVAQEQAAIRTDTTVERMKRLQVSIDDIKIGFFNVAGAMTPYLALIGEFLPAMASLISIIKIMNQGIEFSRNIHLMAKAAIVSKMIAEKAATAATVVMTKAQMALNVVMKSSPVALIVTAIIALVAALITAYYNFEGFRKVVDAAWNGIKKLASVIWDGLVKAFEKVSSVLTPIWGKLKALLGIQDETVQSTEKVIATTDELGKVNEKTGNSVDLLTGLLGDQGKKLNTNLATLGGVEQKISDLKTAQKTAMGEQAIALEKEIRLWEKKQEAMKNALIIASSPKPNLTPITPDTKTYLTAPEAKAQKKEGGFFDGKQKITIDGIEPATASMEGLKKMSDQVSESVKNQQLTWKEWGDKLSQTYNPIETLRNGIASLTTNMINSLGQGAESMAEFGEQVCNTMRETIGGLISLGVSYLVMNAMSSAAAMGPFGFLAAAGLAALAGGLAKTAFNSLIPAFANGGLVYGDTLARVGEYPGAANNPEVIAPLSKLKNMLSPQGYGGGTVEFVIKGNRLVGVLNKENNKGKFF